MNELINVSHGQLMYIGDKTRDYFVASQTKEYDVECRTYTISINSDELIALGSEQS